MTRYLLLLVVLAAACGTTTATPVATTASAATAPPPTVALTTTTTIPQAVSAPDGFTLHGSEALGFQVALPSNWFIADLTTQDIDAIADTLAPDNPDLAELVRSANTTDDFEFRFWAFDLDDAGDGFLTNVNVTVFPRGPLDQPDAYRQALGAQFESIGGELILADLVDAGVDGLYVEMLLPLINAQGQEVVSNGFQIFAFTDAEVINISFSTDTPSQYSDDISVMRETFSAG